MNPFNKAVNAGSTLPAGAQELLKRPLVEVRRGLSIGYDAPSEDSSTIALTAPSGKYVDIRFSTLPRTQAQEALAVKKPDNIWGYATAGLSIATVMPAKENCPPYDCMVHTVWEHSIDSSNTFDTDGADMLLLANGDTMEVGFTLIHGKIQMFKEYWVTPRGRSTDSPCVVVELNESRADDGDGAKGMAIRIGDFCQGILQYGDQFWYERWEIQEGQRAWTKDSRSNTPGSETRILPCLWMTQGARTIAEAITMDGRKWAVTEVVADAPTL